MRIIYTFLLFLLSGCASYYYSYDLEMQHPVISKTLEYENDTLYIEFAIESKDISFTLLNKTNDGIKINWDEVSFSINGKAMRAVHKETGIMTVNMVQPPTTIPPKSSLEDFLMRSDQIRYIGKTNPIRVVDELFPTYDFGNSSKKKKALQLKGTNITIFFPYYIAGKYISQYYTLYVKDVMTSKKKPANISVEKSKRS